MKIGEIRAFDVDPSKQETCPLKQKTYYVRKEPCDHSSKYCDDAEDGKEVKMAVVLDESPFPKGMTVFDDDADGDENSPFEDEFENGYEVICQREIVQIPIYPGADNNDGAASQTMIG